MKVMRFRCKKCGQTYMLGRDAIVVTQSQVMADFKSIATTDGRNLTGLSPEDLDTLVDTRLAPDKVGLLEGSNWSSLEPSTVRNQRDAMERISFALFMDKSRWWKCNKCAKVQTYKLTPMSSKQFKGKTLQEAKTAAMTAIPKEKIVALDVTQDIREKTVEGEGKSAPAAIEDTRARLPSGAFDISPGEIVQEAQHGTVEVQAYSEEEVCKVSKRSMPRGASCEEMKRVLAPSKGLLGIGRKQGFWKVRWSTKFIAKVSFKMPAVVTVWFEK